MAAEALEARTVPQPFLEHNLVSTVIVLIAAAATVITMGRLASLGTWWTRVAHALSRVASG